MKTSVPYFNLLIIIIIVLESSLLMVHLEAYPLYT